MNGEQFDQDSLSHPTIVKKTPYDVLQSAIAAGIQKTIPDCWTNFAHWEVARNFADDPSHPAKDAIEWVYAMDDLRAALDEFEGEAKEACRTALDQAYVAFAKLEHSSELIGGIERWMEYRLSQ